MPHQPGKKGSIGDRFEKLDRTGRRCFSSDMRCERNAAWILTVVAVDPDTGEVRGEPEDRKVCPRHRKFYGEDIRNGYRVLREVEMPPLAPFGGVERAERHQERIDAHVQKKRDQGLPTY